MALHKNYGAMWKVLSQTNHMCNMKLTRRNYSKLSDMLLYLAEQIHHTAAVAEVDRSPVVHSPVVNTLVVVVHNRAGQADRNLEW